MSVFDGRVSNTGTSHSKRTEIFRCRGFHRWRESGVVKGVEGGRVPQRRKETNKMKKRVVQLGKDPGRGKKLLSLTGEFHAGHGEPCVDAKGDTGLNSQVVVGTHVIFDDAAVGVITMIAQ